jgi:hypothetical protein
VKSGRRLPRILNNVLPPSSGWKLSVEEHGIDIGSGLVGTGALSEPIRVKRKGKKNCGT